MRTPVAVQAAVCLAAAAAPLLLAGPAAQRRATEGLVLVLLALSMTVTTGWLRTAALHAPACLLAGGGATILLLGRGQALPVALLIAAGVGAATGVVAVLPVVRRHRELVPLTTLLATFAAWGVLLPTARLTPVVRPVVLGIDLAGERALYLTALAVVATGWVVVERLSASPLGRRSRVAGADERYAAATGIATPPTWCGLFALSGVLAGLAGALLAVTAQGLPPADSASPAMALIVLAAALLGGAGRPAGALVGAALFTLAPVLVPAVPAAQEVLAGLVLTAAVVWPAARCGLLGLLDHDPGIG